MYAHTDMFTPVPRTPGRTNQFPPLKIPVEYFLYHNRYYRLILFKTSEERRRKTRIKRYRTSQFCVTTFYVLHYISLAYVFGDSYSNECLVSY
uniref:Uncharacterized protein n=1 Tax=Octopus bimaculoides TaxID=37653 RepID=A0A0L8G163_OCTBM